MRIAATVFVIAGLAYLAWDVRLTFQNGIQLGTWLMGLFALGLIYQGYVLFRVKKGARWSGFASATIVALSSGYFASVFVFPGFPETLYAMPADVLPTFGTLVTVTVVFAAAALLIAFSNRAP